MEVLAVVSTGKAFSTYQVQFVHVVQADNTIQRTGLLGLPATKHVQCSPRINSLPVAEPRGGAGGYGLRSGEMI